jgi:nickel-dependent lactate racemase
VNVCLDDFDVAFEVRDGCYVPGRRVSVAPDLPDLRAAIRQALETPRNFPPLRRALTPDDRVAVVIDDQLPQLGVCVSEILTYLQEAGIDPAAVTLISPRGAKQAWVDDLPDAVQAARTEIHDPSNRRALCYLASTRAGRRIYLNRTVVEADFAIVLTSYRYDPTDGVHEAARALFPALSDDATLQDAGSRSLAEASEVAWLLGVPFLVHVIEGSGERVAHVVSGTLESSADCAQLLEKRWCIRYTRPAELVIATMTGDSRRHDFAAIARAARAAASVCEAGGKIVLLTRSAPEFGPWREILRNAASPDDAIRQLHQQRPVGHDLALQWLEAARHASLYWLSQLDDEIVEELFAIPMVEPEQAQRLIDAARSCLLLEDAHKALPVIE